MHTRIALLVSLIASGASCKSVDCGDGTTESNGVCIPAGVTVGNATCGPFTILNGTECVPEFPPTQCDPGSTAEDVDARGVTTCVGTGAGGCAARLACPTPAAGKQTICGQIYDFETGQPFADSGATGTQCTAATTTGPCALGIKAYDAVAFALSSGAGGALTVGATYLDNCGRYRLSDVSQPTQASLVAIGVDDIASPGPTGLASPVGVSLSFAARATPDIEAFTVKPATIAGYAGPSLASGIYALMYRSRSTGSELAEGVTVTRNGGTDSAHDYYFSASATTRTTIDTTNVTGANGTALFTITNPQPTDQYSGIGGTQCSCVWPAFASLPVPGVMFVQIFRPTSASGMTCPL